MPNTNAATRFKKIMRFAFALSILAGSYNKLHAQQYSALYENRTDFHFGDITINKPVVGNGNKDTFTNKLFDSTQLADMMKTALFDAMTGFTMEVKLRTSKDSTFISERQKENPKQDPGIELTVKGASSFMMYHGTLFISDDKGGYVIDTARQRTQPISIHKTGEKMTILGYKAEAYTDGTKLNKYWICKELPNTINAGLVIKDLPGAVLGYHRETAEATEEVKLLSIKKD